MCLLTFSLETAAMYEWVAQKGDLEDEQQGSTGLDYNSPEKSISLISTHSIHL